MQVYVTRIFLIDTLTVIHLWSLQFCRYSDRMGAISREQSKDIRGNGSVVCSPNTREYLGQFPLLS